MNRGMEFHGEVKSADANAGVAFDLYPAGGTAAHTLAGTEIVSIDAMLVSGDAQAGGLTSIAFDADAAGERVFQAYLSQHGASSHRLSTPHQGPPGVVPKLISPAGNVVAQIHGFISRA